MVNVCMLDVGGASGNDYGIYDYWNIMVNLGMIIVNVQMTVVSLKVIMVNVWMMKVILKMINDNRESGDDYGESEDD